MRVPPQTHACLTRLLFKPEQLAQLAVPAVDPCQPDLDQLAVDADLLPAVIAHIHPSHRASVPIPVHHVDPDLLAENQRARELLRPLSECLASLGTVYAGKADADLPFRRGEDGDRVPVGHTDAAASESLGRRGSNEKCDKEECGQNSQAHL